MSSRENEILQQFDQTSFFIDYFIEVGIKPDIILKEDFLNSKTVEEINQNISPTLISKLPNIDKKTISIDESIVNHLFPNGFNAIRSKTPPKPLHFNLVLDNQFYSAVYTNKYIACMKIYESLSQYRIIHNLYYNKTDNANIEFEQEVFIPKCICLISVHPFLDYFHQILDILHQYVQKTYKEKGGVFLFDKIIEKVVIEIPALPRGITQFKVNLLKNNIDLHQKKLNELPMINFDMKDSLEIFKVDKIIDIFKHLLYETKMIFFSENLVLLSNVILSFVNLLFPFKYQFQISSILPKSYYQFVENVTPFIFGINEKYNSKFFSENDISMNKLDILVVDIDQAAVHFFTSSQKPNQDFPEIPKSYRSKLEDSLKKARKKGDYTAQDMQDIFLNFMINVLELYPKFLKHDYGACHETNEITSLINIHNYLSSVGSGEKEFYQKIFSTQMFIEFMFKRMMPKDSFDILEIIFFEEKITEKMQKKKIFSKAKPSVFINCKDYDFSSEWCCINIEKPELSKYDLEFFSTDKAKQDTLLNGIKCEVENGTYKFSYILFPSLLPDSLFYKNAKNHTFPSNFSERLEEPNSRIVSISNFTVNNNHICDMENYVYLCWMIVWALTFWYTDQKEKKKRFEQLKEIMAIVHNHEMEIFELLFSTLTKYGDEEMVIQLYKIIIHRRLNPSWNIYNMVTKIINKKENVGKNIAKILRMSSIRYNTKGINMEAVQNGINEDGQFRKRTLKDKYDSNVLSEDVTFYAYDQCIDCQKNFNLYDQSKKLEEIPYDEFWLNCPNCNNNNILLKLNFRFGVELFNSDITNESSSHKDDVILYSPKTLKDRLMKMALSLEGDFNVEEFKYKYKVFFWNFVWYFKIVNIDISFMLPYVNSPKEIKSDTSDIIFFSEIKEKQNDKSSSDQKLIPDSSNDPLLSQIQTQKTNKLMKMNTLTNLLYSQKELIKQPVYDFEVIPYVGVIASQTSKLSIVNDTKPSQETLNSSMSSFNEHNSYSINNDDYKSNLKLNSINEDVEYKNKKLDSDDPFKVDVDDLKIFGTLKEDYCAVGDDNKDNFDFDSSDEKSNGSDLNDSDSYEKYNHSP